MIAEKEKIEVVKKVQKRTKITFGDVMAVYNAVASGANTPELVEGKTGMEVKKVKAAINKLKREGTLTVVLSIKK